MDFTTIRGEISRCETLDDLRPIYKMLKTRWNQIVAIDALQFVLGDIVSFRGGPRGIHYEGEVIKVNRKTVTVHTSNGANWRVAPSFLTKVK